MIHAEFRVIVTGCDDESIDEAVRAGIASIARASEIAHVVWNERDRWEEPS